MKIGLIAALPIEARIITQRHVPIGDITQVTETLFACASGIGSQAAKQATQAMLARGVDLLISFGTAAGLDPQFKAGMLIYPNTVIHPTHATLTLDTTWHERLQLILRRIQEPTCELSTAPILCSDTIITSPKQKQILNQKFQAVAADMESYAIAQMAKAAHKPCLCLRAITDTAEMHLPVHLLKKMDNHGKIKMRALFTGFCRHPNEIVSLLHLGIAFHKARKTLSHAAEALHLLK